MAWLKNPFKKESATGVAVSQFVQGQVIHTPRDYESLSKEGYIKCVIANRCINLLAQSVASVPWMLFNGNDEIERHPVLDLLAKPNPSVGGSDFLGNLAAFFSIAGNCYIEASRLNNSPPLELYLLRPDRMKIVGGARGLPSLYRYTANGVDVDFPVDPITGRSNVYHMRNFHPTNDWYGLAPIEAAAFSIDQHNAAGEHNAALLQNRATPAGTLIFKGDPGKDEKERVQQIMLDRYSSPRNAGKPLILGGDVEWKEMGLSPKELDYNKSFLTIARDICNGFGIPHILVVPGESTYRNMEEAQLMLWDGAVIPLLKRIKEGPMAWLLSFYGKGMTLEYDLDEVSALIPRRTMHREAVMAEYNSGLIKKNEAREALGYDTVKDGDIYHGESAGTGKKPVVTDPAADTSAPKKSAQLGQKSYMGAMIFTAPDEIDDPTLKAEVTTFLEGLFAQIVKKYGEQVVREIGEKISFQSTVAIQQYITESTATLVTNVNDTTKTRLRAAIGEAFANQEGVAEIRERIEEVFAQAATSRARTIATTESTRVTGYASGEAISQSGVNYKEWVSTLDGSTRDAHFAMDGQVVPAGAKFEAPGGLLASHPGGFGIARLDINCRCAIAAAFPEKSAKSMTETERRELWGLREKSRKTAEKEVLETFEKIFTMQREAVLKKISAIAGET